MTNLNNFVTAVESFKRLNPTKTNIITGYIADKIAIQKEHQRENFYRSYNVGLLDAIALTDDYSLEAVQGFVDALPASDSDSMVEHIRGVLASGGKARKPDYLVRDIDSIVNGTSGNRQSVLDATFEVLVSWLEVKHGELNSQWTGKDIEPLLG
ncbi:hypothetical protein H6G97_41725 [Nostoc flagelliforme FACHB-838]|uniref:Uncharacterized protein n=1 Tax=Nostoc flagelliforme FACHB-838 TaxID=2692904 RepID=A0ABR8E1N3_9NOSO|nr:hypothetical protein [Nostoc flagelliforme]MBD2535561.1 hypothetical protein [Nostoc flagelliforme FACHB-838]